MLKENNHKRNQDHSRKQSGRYPQFPIQQKTNCASDDQQIKYHPGDPVSVKENSAFILCLDSI